MKIGSLAAARLFRASEWSGTLILRSILTTSFAPVLCTTLSRQAQQPPDSRLLGSAVDICLAASSPFFSRHVLHSYLIGLLFPAEHRSCIRHSRSDPPTINDAIPSKFTTKWLPTSVSIPCVKETKPSQQPRSQSQSCPAGKPTWM